LFVVEQLSSSKKKDGFDSKENILGENILTMQALNQILFKDGLQFLFK
jgi:hypothetical protein